ncbi:MAG: hypothetical protein QXW47_04990 [Candidatus Jordarchaeales archaeon]|nr:single-stranded DNA-binding protein [Candidatus Jordarchaeia archaeon]
MEENVEFKSVNELNPASRRVNLKVKVVNVSDVREVVSRRDGSVHKVAEALVGDKTGSILLTLWDDAISEVSPGSSMMIKNGYVSLFRGQMRLNLGRYGNIETIEEEIEANTDNNLSDNVYRQPSMPRSSFGQGEPYRKKPRRGGQKPRRRR